MAASGYTPIQLYYSPTTTNVPLAANLAAGELAINTADGKLFYKDSGGTVQVLATKSTATIGGSNRQVQYNNNGVLGGDSGFVYDSSGNLGLGVTPSAWSAYKVMQLSGISGIYANGQNEFGTFQNAYYNSGWKYGATGIGSTWMTQYQGTYAWNIAPSGTAGNAITFTQAMTLDASGNLLVGTTSATEKLTVQGNIAATSTTGIPIFKAWSNQASGYAPSQLQLYRTGASSTATPDNSQLGEIRFDGLSTGGIYDNAAFIGVASGVNATGGMPTYMSFGTASSGANATERMRIDTSGNVGIGTSSPVSRLQVGGGLSGSNATYVGDIQINGNPASLAQTGGLEFKTSTFGSGYGWKISSIDSSGVQLVFGTRQNSATWSEAMRIDSSGNVLIGQTSTSAGADGKLAVTTTGGSPAGTFKNDAGSGQYTGVFYNSATTGNNSFVLFGTEGTFTSRGGITYNRGAGLTAYNTTSDQRLKENIVDASSALSKIDSVKVRSFDWKETGNHVDFGVIAQELVTVAPECVTEGDDGDEIKSTWQVDTSALVPALVKAIQELSAKVTALEEQVINLGAK